MYVVCIHNLYTELVAFYHYNGSVTLIMHRALRGIAVTNCDILTIYCTTIAYILQCAHQLKLYTHFLATH